MNLRAVRRADLAVAAIVAAFVATFLPLTLLRHTAFSTARYDLGNMTQAVWSVAHGGLFRTTDPSGVEVSRLGSHVDPILALFAPLWRVWPDPRMLIVVQVLAVASTAIPAYLFARRRIGDEGIAVAFAAVPLLYPAVQWATVFDFHPVTLAIPLIMWCVWAADARRDVTFAICAVLALATKEQVGLALALMGVWVAFGLGRRRMGLILSAGALTWTVLAIWVVIPAFNDGNQSAFLADRYGRLGDTAGEVLVGVVTDPVEALRIVATTDRATYLLALFLPLLFLPLRAPLLALGALPDLALNLLSSRPAQHQIQYHYGAVIAPFLIAATIVAVGAMARDGGRLRRLMRDPRPVAIVLVVAGVLAGWRLGPLPFWRHVPGGSTTGAGQFTVTDHSRVLAEAVSIVPAGATVSAGNHIGGHLSARRRIATFPTIAGAEFVLIDVRTPDIDDERQPARHAVELGVLRADPAYDVIFERDGVMVFRRRVGA